MNIAEKLATIAENEQKVYKSGVDQGKLDLLTESEYMNAKISGTAIAVNDVSPIEHNVGCKLSSKNLLDVSSELTWKGAYSVVTHLKSQLKVGVKYVLYYDAVEFSTESAGIAFIVNGKNIANPVAKPQTAYYFVPDKDITAFYIYTNGWNAPNSNNVTATVTNLRICLADVDYLNYTPYIEDFSNIEVIQYKNNLINPNYCTSKYLVTIENDGSITMEAGEYQGNKPEFTYEIPIKAGTYTLSFDNKPSNYVMYVYLNDRDNEVYSTMTATGNFTFTVNEDTVLIVYVWAVPTENNGGNMTIKLEVGETATPYEPYAEPTTYQPNADGTLKGIIKSISPNMTLLTNNGVLINAQYLRDIDTYIDNLITNVALTGGE